MQDIYSLKTVTLTMLIFLFSPILYGESIDYEDFLRKNLSDQTFQPRGERRGISSWRSNDLKKRLNCKQQDKYVVFDHILEEPSLALEALKKSKDPFMVFIRARFLSYVLNEHTPMNLSKSKNVIKAKENIQKLYKKAAQAGILDAQFHLFKDDFFSALKQAPRVFSHSSDNRKHLKLEKQPENKRLAELMVLVEKGYGPALKLYVSQFMQDQLVVKDREWKLLPVPPSSDFDSNFKRGYEGSPEKKEGMLLCKALELGADAFMGCYKHHRRDAVKRKSLLMRYLAQDNPDAIWVYYSQLNLVEEPFELRFGSGFFSSYNKHNLAQKKLSKSDRRKGYCKLLSVGHDKIVRKAMQSDKDFRNLLKSH